MRERIFRGKDYKGKWVYGSLVEHKVMTSNGKISSYNILYQDENDWGSFNEIKQCSVEKETIGQFTGRTDKNGREIYEGDIVKSFVNYPNGKKYEVIREVKWINDRLFPFADDDLEYGNWWEELTKNCEVIGNIYDTPELLGIDYILTPCEKRNKKKKLEKGE